MASSKSLTIMQLKEVFGTSHVAIFNWVHNLGFPAVGERTAGAVSRWAKQHGKAIVRSPLDVLSGRRNKKADAVLKRTATGRLTSARAAASTGTKKPAKKPVTKATRAAKKPVTTSSRPAAHDGREKRVTRSKKSA